jgi:tetratricopeptide (TPR) repeat protein
MMRPVLLFLALACAASPASAAITTYGTSQAQACFEAARDHRGDLSAVRTCDAALNDPLLLPEDQAKTLINRGVVRLARKEAIAALADFDKAIAVRPAIGEAYVNRGAALILMGRFQDAIQSINRGMELGSEDPHEAYFNRALAKERLDDLQGAYADFKKAAELKPDWGPAQDELRRFTVQKK